MDKLKVLIVEDDNDMSLVLYKVLKGLPYIGQIDQAKNGIEALEKYQEIGHNVVFLDIDMPIISGIEVARKISNYRSFKLQLRASPFIIFATGYDNYMPESNEVYAYDYILKPYNFERINHTMDRIYSLYLDHINVSKITIKVANDICLIDVNDIIFITKEGHDTVIITVGREMKNHEPLETIEKQLLGYSQFMRTHKGFIVNMLRVSTIKKINKKVYNVIFKDTDKIAMMTLEKKKKFELMSGIGKEKISLLNRIFNYN